MAPSFPSPSGDLYLQITIHRIVRGHDEFPSPSGDLYLQMFNGMTDKQCAERFRPLPGIYIFKFITFPAVGDALVSVPFRGSISSNAEYERVAKEMGFPSPSGDLYLQINYFGGCNHEA